MLAKQRQLPVPVDILAWGDSCFEVRSVRVLDFRHPPTHSGGLCTTHPAPSPEKEMKTTSRGNPINKRGAELTTLAALLRGAAVIL